MMPAVGPVSQLLLSMGRCRFIYQEPREARLEIRKEAESAAASGAFLLPLRTMTSSASTNWENLELPSVVILTMGRSGLVVVARSAIS
jgi:hypothetical protein